MGLQVRSSRSMSMRKPKEPEANRSRILAAATAEFAAQCRALDAPGLLRRAERLASRKVSTIRDLGLDM